MYIISVYDIVKGPFVCESTYQCLVTEVQLEDHGPPYEIMFQDPPPNHHMPSYTMTVHCVGFVFMKMIYLYITMKHHHTSAFPLVNSLVEQPLGPSCTYQGPGAIVLSTPP